MTTRRDLLASGLAITTASGLSAADWFVMVPLGVIHLRVENRPSRRTYDRHHAISRHPT